MTTSVPSDFYKKIFLRIMSLRAFTPRERSFWQSDCITDVRCSVYGAPLPFGGLKLQVYKPPLSVGFTCLLTTKRFAMVQ